MRGGSSSWAISSTGTGATPAGTRCWKPVINRPRTTARCSSRSRRCPAPTSTSGAASRDRVFSDRGVTSRSPARRSGRSRSTSCPGSSPRRSGRSIERRRCSQRVLALERFLADVYGPGEIIRDRIVPRRLVVTSKHFHRAVAGVEPTGDVRVHVAGIDLVRDGEGRRPRPRGQRAHAVGDLLRGGC